MSGRAAVRIELEQAERAELETRARRRKSFRADAMRAEIVLLAATGVPNLVIAKRLGITRTTVTTWRTHLVRTVTRYARTVREPTLALSELDEAIARALG